MHGEDCGLVGIYLFLLSYVLHLLWFHLNSFSVGEAWNAFDHFLSGSFAVEIDCIDWHSYWDLYDIYVKRAQAFQRLKSSKAVDKTSVFNSCINRFSSYSNYMWLHHALASNIGGYININNTSNNNYSCSSIRSINIPTAFESLERVPHALIFIGPS